MSDLHRDAVAKAITDLVLTAASGYQKGNNGEVCAREVAEMRLSEIVEILGSGCKCKGYAKDVMNMVLSYAEAVATAGGSVCAAQDQNFEEMVATLAHNGIRFHYEPTPERLAKQKEHPHPFDPEHDPHLDHYDPNRYPEDRHSEDLGRLDGHNA